jgi:hypothetical protein
MNHNISELIVKARGLGATVLVTYDEDAKRYEGRLIIDSVQVIGLKGCGPFTMGSHYAGERLGELLA